MQIINHKNHHKIWRYISKCHFMSADICFKFSNKLN